MSYHGTWMDTALEATGFSTLVDTTVEAAKDPVMSKLEEERKTFTSTISSRTEEAARSQVKEETRAAIAVGAWVAAGALALYLILKM
jgi:hypothetical protein